MRARVAEAVRGAVLQALLADTPPLCVAVCGLLCRSTPPQQTERGLAALLADWGDRAQQALVEAVSQHAGTLPLPLPLPLLLPLPLSLTLPLPLTR